MSEDNTTEAPIEPDLPAQIVEAPDYDPENPDHLRRWELAGRPAMDERDTDGHFWRPSITKVLQPDGTYRAIPAPGPAGPVSDDERLRQGVALYKAANDAAKEIILSLMVMVAGALIALKLFTEENVNDEGAKFVAFHRDALTDFERAGRNRLAAQSLLAAIKDPASVSTFEWLKESAVMAVFESALTY